MYSCGVYNVHHILNTQRNKLLLFNLFAVNSVDNYDVTEIYNIIFNIIFGMNFNKITCRHKPCYIPWHCHFIIAIAINYVCIIQFISRHGTKLDNALTSRWWICHLFLMKKLDHPNVIKLVEVLDDPDEDNLNMGKRAWKKRSSLFCFVVPWKLK